MNASFKPHDRNERLKRHRRVALFGVALALSLLSLIPGCKQKPAEVEIFSLEGRVQKVTPKPDGTGEITVVYYNEKQKQEVVGVGLVTRETEIMINGAAASLKDVQLGDRVRGQVKMERKSGKTTLTALRMQVDRGG